MRTVVPCPISESILADPSHASACGCDDGAPMKVSGSSRLPLCNLRCDIGRRTSGLLSARGFSPLPRRAGQCVNAAA